MGPVGGMPHASAGARWSRAARGRRRARGQALVEFALVAPIFLLLLFAVVEYALINAAVGTYNFAAKDAARYGAIAGPTLPNADVTIQNLITSHVLGVVAAQLKEVDIFEATESGTYATTQPQDSWTYANGAWTVLYATWPQGARNDQLVSQDYLGVRIVYQYTYVTAFFISAGATITLNATSVQRIEPQEIRAKPTPGASGGIASRDPFAPSSPYTPLLTLGALLPGWVVRPRWRHPVRLGIAGKERRV